MNAVQYDAEINFNKILEMTGSIKVKNIFGLSLM